MKELKELSRNFEYSENIKYSGPYVGEEADYKIIWERYPTPEETFALVRHLDDVLANCGCKYTVSTETVNREDLFAQIEASRSDNIALTFVRLIGPSISQAIEILNERITDFPGVKAITGELIGRYDYAFEWVRIPEVHDIIRLSETMDRFLARTGVIYHIATKSKLKRTQIPQLSIDIEREMETKRDQIQFVVSRMI